MGARPLGTAVVSRATYCLERKCWHFTFVCPDMLLQSENDWLLRGPACGIPNDDTCAVEPGPLSAVAPGLPEAADSERAAAA